jgi:protocatechuate 3,4-dioxygenase beta subunit
MTAHRLFVGVLLVGAVAATTHAGDARASGAVRGFVDRGEHDAPEPGRAVTLIVGDAPPRTATTDAWGRFAFDGVATGVACEVRVDADDAAPVRAPLPALLSGETRDVGELWLGPAGGFDAFVADETGAPIVGATVEAFRESADGLEGCIEFARLDVARVPAVVATTDAKGHAVLAAARGASWTLAARAPGRSRAAFARLASGKTAPHDVAFQLAKAERLSGRVVDAAGRPVPSAVVVARRSIASWGTCGTCSPLEEGAALWQPAVADVEGRYAFDALPPGRIQLLAAPPGGAPSYAGAVMFPDARELDVALPATATIRGRVTDEATGAPVAGVVVCAKGGAVRTACRTTTDADGAYVLAGVPAGAKLERELHAPPGWTGARWTTSFAYESELRAGQTATLDATVSRGAVVTGRVTCGDVPLAGASVRVATLPEQGDNLFGRVVDGKSDAEGVFRVEDVQPGTIAVFACAAGDDASAAWKVFYKSVVQDAAGRDREGVAAAAGATVRRDVAVVRTPPDATKSPLSAAIEEMRRATVRVKIRVATADGLALVDAKFGIGATDEDAQRRIGDFWTRVPPGGLVDQDLPIPPGVRSFYVAAEDDRHGVATAEVSVADGAKEASAEVVLPARATTRGRVVAGGKPVVGASILLAGAVVAQSADDGAFVARCGPGVEIGVQARGFVRREFKDWTPSDDGVVEFELTPAGAVEGRVVDAAGKPVAGLSVAPLDGRDEILAPYRGWRGSTPPTIPVTDADGRFAFDELPPGAWRLRVEAPPGVAVATTTSDAVAVGTRDARIEVRAERRVAGRVLDPTGAPVAGARVFCRPGPGDAEKAETRTDERGRFAFRGLGDGARVLDVEPPWRAEFVPARRRVEPGGKDVDIALVAASSISGFVVTESGEPFERCVVEAVRVDEPKEGEAEWTRDLYAWTETKNGKCSFRIVVPPDAKWRVRMSRRTMAHAALKGGENVASGTNDLRLVADEGLTIAGIAVDEEGKPVVRADVESWLGPGDPRRMRTQEDGRFKLTALPEGAFLCVVVQEESRVPVRLFGVRPGTNDLRVVLRPGMTITGRLLDANGKPDSNHWVRALSAKWAAADLWRARPEKDGTFVIRGLEPGEWMLESFVPGCMTVNDVVDQGKAKAGATDVELKLPAR